MKKHLNKDELENNMQKIIGLAETNADIAAVFIFGSHAVGKATPLSDIDIAVLLDKSVTNADYLSTRLRLLGEISTTLNTDRVDLVILNEVTPLLGYRVIKDGKLIYLKAGTKSQLVNFQVCTLDKYFDFQPTQRMLSEGLAKRIKEGSFGGR